ncbi:flagellar hook-length control protein FliK [Polaromonas sp.]|uniref:flagellar hook-length control protein FliK n=1 Tax=Polaromonas sp. TaxID=1869339 RepID=UPI002FC5BDF0
MDLIPLKAQLEIAGPGAVTNVEEVANDVRLPSRAALQRQLGVALLDRDHGGDISPSVRPGGTVTLSTVARAIGAILDLQSGATHKIRGEEPLWPQRQPPVAHLLTATLARTVAASGLFYESHLQQYAAGTRTLAQLAQEPQARFDALARTEGTPGTRPDAAAVVPSDASAEPPASVQAGAAANAGTIKGSESDAAPAAMRWPAGLPARPDAAHLAAAYGRASGRDKAPAPVHIIAGQFPAGPPQGELAPSGGRELHAVSERGGRQFPAGPPQGELAPSGGRELHAVSERGGRQFPDAKNPGASALDAVRNDSPVAGVIHPDAMALVRQQLELLANPVFRWGGEAWPGTPMDWDIHQERDESQAAADGEAVQRTWTTRLALTLPTLGAVEVRLSLAGATLQVHLAARETATLALLSNEGKELPQRFGALGLQLTGLQMGALAVEPATQDTRKDDDAA